MTKSEKSGAQIRTSGQLRTFLADMLLGLKNGHVEPDTASRITKMAAQINESLYAEIKVARVLTEMKQETQTFGSLSLGENAES